MAEVGDGGFGPHQAIESLARLERYEENLTARTAGLTWIVWGAAVAGIFMTYNVGAHWIGEHGAPGWLYAVLWMPWTLLGTLATNWLWETTAITLERDPQRTRGWLAGLGYTALFFVIMGAVYGLVVATGLTLDTNAIMLVITGLFTIAVGLAYHLQGLVGAALNVLGGALLVAAGLGLTVTTWSSPALGMAAAGAVALVYTVLGTVLYTRG